MTAILEDGVNCAYCDAWIPSNQSHQCKGVWGGWHPPVVEICPHCGGAIEKWIDFNQGGKND